jgi:hypothetical protein
VTGLFEAATTALTAHAAAKTPERPEPEPPASLGFVGRLIDLATNDGELDARQAVNAAAVRRAPARREPAALPLVDAALDARLEQAPQLAPPPVRVPRATVWRFDASGRPRVVK